jgi:hypothetical protein
VILGPGWPLLGLIAVGIAAFSLIPGCGLAVVDNASENRIQLDAPALVEAEPAVEARSAAVASVAVGKARRALRRDMLRVRTKGCAGATSGSGFALDARTVLASREVLPASTTLAVVPRGGRTKTVAKARVFHLGGLGIARVGGRVPVRSPLAESVPLGASIAVVGGPLSPAPRLVPGVVVDEIAGAPFGVKGRVLRLSTRLRDDDPGGPVIDAKGRIVAVAFATDPATGFAVAVPLGTLRSLVAARTLAAAPACEGA